MNTQEFDACLERSDFYSNAAYITVPFNVFELFGERGHVRVNASVDDQKYRSFLVPTGDGRHLLGVSQETRSIINKDFGDDVHVLLETDLTPRELPLPRDFQAVLTQNPAARDFYRSLSPHIKREIIIWIDTAKSESARQTNVETAVAKLAKKDSRF